MSRRIGAKGLALIKQFEGFKPRRYRDPVGIWTQGYGETQGTDDTAWSESRAAERLERRVNRDYAPAVSAAAKRYKLDLDQEEFDALCSIAYNLGAGAFTPGASTGSTLRKALASRSRARIGRAFMAYVFAGGVRFFGLVRRRRAERRLFLTRKRHLDGWRKELSTIRRYVRRHGNDWTKFPERRKRAEQLKAAIRRHTPNE